MRTKYDLIVRGDGYMLDTLQSHAEMIRKYTDGTYYNITRVIRSKDSLLIRVEDEAPKVEKLRDMIRYRFPRVRLMLARISKQTGNNG